ncbi:uncharacterized protein BO80DRAFT_421762 [Aspergillus ibericus CBS 121593]|uniref:Uncharacterized protein n=1 Tax=Aspergillus ibericus CBS 121593 TaxID=1448316 RepID=A0A395HBP2_9EURO|nr:hypothetical protein BO80DRAFT_421762 [Aspergillus ibericus CBS 121593]RAL05120.1 hypothetical protein BO80DRAFT_421762 [Aspergillus ibericus CBS 121593]
MTAAITRSPTPRRTHLLRSRPPFRDSLGSGLIPSYCQPSCAPPIFFLGLSFVLSSKHCSPLRRPPGRSELLRLK